MGSTSFETFEGGPIGSDSNAHVTQQVANPSRVRFCLQPFGVLAAELRC